MQTVRLYDPGRRPRDWMEIIQPGEFAVFASRVEGGTPCDLHGTLTSHEAATCVIVGSLAEAEAACLAAVEAHPEVRCDIFDAAGRRHPPLLTVVHPSRRPALEGAPSARRRNVVAAVLLIGVAPVLFWIDWQAAGLMGWPTVVGVNGLLLGARLLQLNAAYVGAERDRRARQADAASQAPIGQ